MERTSTAPREQDPGVAVPSTPPREQVRVYRTAIKFSSELREAEDERGRMISAQSTPCTHTDNGNGNGTFVLFCGAWLSAARRR